MSALIPKSILVAAELGGPSGDSLRAAAALAALSGADLHALHAFDLEDSPHVPDPDVATTFPARIAEAERALADLLRRVVPPHQEVASRRVVIRSAFKAILERAREVEADLIVMGPHRRRSFADRLLGSTADRVIRTAEAPCLIVRSPLSLPLRRVVAPVDLSDHALRALDVALTWGRSFGAGSRGAVEVDVVHVIPTMFDSSEFPFDRAVVGPELDREIQRARVRIDGASEMEVREELLWGDRPADEIVRFAEQSHADLLVLATHGYGAFRRALVGSVASAVTREAPCSVLLVPPRGWREDGLTAANRRGRQDALVMV